MKPLQVISNDGGRRAAGYQGSTGDCVCRAVAIASGRSYAQVYADLAEINAAVKGVRSARNGVFTGRSSAKGEPFHGYMEGIGFTWVPTMKFGTGCTVHLRRGELPNGRLVVKVSRHMCAVIDGVIFDTHDPTRGGTRCVYGYYRLDRPVHRHVNK